MGARKTFIITWLWGACLVIFCLAPGTGRLVTSAYGAWSGVDEAVVEKIAREHGRVARKPLIDPGTGDILLFVFLAAGVAGGFAGGYYWRMLVGEKKSTSHQGNTGKTG